MLPPSPTGLYWSLYGEVACAEHVPQVDDSRWHRDGWAPVKVRSDTVQGPVRDYQCQYCARDGHSVASPPNNTAPKSPPPLPEASNPLSRGHAADMLEQLRSLRDRSRMLKADIKRGADENEKRAQERIDPERSEWNWDNERVAGITELMNRAQDHMNEAVRLQADGMPQPRVRREL